MSSANAAGRRLAGFVVEGEIGRGGMGVVLLARQESLGRPAVLKRIRSDLAEHPELLARFEREARAAAALHHPNVVAVYELFSHRGAHYIAQEYVDGVDLASALVVEGPLPWRVAACIGLEVARGLEAVHARGTLHRDLKPANLLLGRRGEVKIGDFGLALDTGAASLTRPGVVLGTPAYMAPEQLRCDRVDGRADLFAFGCVLYEMLTGASPYAADQAREPSGTAVPGPTIAERMQQERYTPPRRLRRDIPRPLARLVKSCLRARPGRRIASAGALRRELERIVGLVSPEELRAELAGWLWERGVFAPRPDETLVMVPAGGVARRRRWPAAAAVALAMAGLALTLAWPDVATRAHRLRDAVALSASPH